MRKMCKIIAHIIDAIWSKHIIWEKDVFSTMFHSDYILNYDIIWWWLYIQIRFCTKSHYSVNSLQSHSLRTELRMFHLKAKISVWIFHVIIFQTCIFRYAVYLTIFRFYRMSIFRNVPISWTFLRCFYISWRTTTFDWFNYVRGPLV